MRRDRDPARVKPLSIVARLSFVSVHVRDLARAAAFYGDVLGLRLLDAKEDERFYDLGGMPLSVHVDRDGACGRAPGGATGFYLQVQDAGAAAEALAARGAAVQWEDERMLSVADPDGNELVLWQPRDPWPPQAWPIDSATSV